MLFGTVRIVALRLFTIASPHPDTALRAAAVAALLERTVLRRLRVVGGARAVDGAAWGLIRSIGAAPGSETQHDGTVATAFFQRLLLGLPHCRIVVAIAVARALVGVYRQGGVGMRLPGKPEAKRRQEYHGGDLRFHWVLIGRCTREPGAPARNRRDQVVGASLTAGRTDTAFDLST